MIDEDLIERYLGEIAQCTTLNQFNRVHIQVEIHFSPEEVCALIDGVKARGIPLIVNLQRWHAIMDEAIRGGGRRVEPYVRTPVARAAAMYAAPGTPEERARRTLVIAFTGNADRLMLPLAMFLQHCPADEYEFLVLFDRSRHFFLNGVTGMGADLPTTLDAIREKVDPSRYRRAVSFGTSGGGFAAIWTAVEMRLERGVSVGGPTPAQIAGTENGHDLDTSGFQEAIRRHADRLPDVLYVAGELSQYDTAKGHALQSYLPTTSIVVPGCNNHNTIQHARRAGGLERLLARLLGERSSAAAASA